MATQPAEYETSRLVGEPDNLILPVTNRRFTYDGFRVEIFTGETYKTQLLPLKVIAARFNQRIYGITFEQAWLEINQNIKPSGSMYLVKRIDDSFFEERGKDRVRASANNGWMDSLTHTARNVLRLEIPAAEPKLDLELGDYIGYSAQQKMILKTARGRKILMYMVDMALLRGFRRAGVGAVLFEIANSLEQPDIIAFRSQSSVPLASAVKADVVERGRVRPTDILFDEDTEGKNLIELLDIRTAHPKPVDHSTGLTIAVYPEGENKAFRVDPKHELSFNTYVILVKNIGMEPKRGDGVYFSFDVKGKRKHYLQEPIEEFVVDEI